MSVLEGKKLPEQQYIPHFKFTFNLYMDTILIDSTGNLDTRILLPFKKDYHLFSYFQHYSGLNWSTVFFPQFLKP